MILATNYLGLPLKNPIVASSSPLSHNVDSIRRLEEAGAAAVVMYSLFEEQISFDSFDVDYYLTRGTDSFAESLSYFPEMQSYNVGPDEYMKLISQQHCAEPAAFERANYMKMLASYRPIN